MSAEIKADQLTALLLHQELSLSLSLRNITMPSAPLLHECYQSCCFLGGFLAEQLWRTRKIQCSTHSLHSLIGSCMCCENKKKASVGLSAVSSFCRIVKHAEAFHSLTSCGADHTLVIPIRTLVQHRPSAQL